MANVKKKAQHPNVVTVSGADALRRETDRLVKQGFTPAPMPNDFGRHGKGSDGPDHRWEEYIHAQLMCKEPGSKPGRGYPTLHLSSGGEVPCDNCGTKGLGYMSWGVTNRNPNFVTLLREASPYTASAHKFNVDLCEGRGPRAVYAYTQYVGGNITEKRIAFKDAGVLIKGWIRDLKQQLIKLEQDNPDLLSSPSISVVTPAGDLVEEPNAARQLHEDIQNQIDQLEKEFAKWEQSNEEIQKLLRRNNLHLTYLQLIEDMQDQNICFPEITLNKRTLDADGKNAPTNMWTPKITGLRYRSAHTCRLERKDDNGRINYVYVSNRWYDQVSGVATTLDEQKIDALPALDPQTPLTDLQRIVRETRKENGSIRRRPTRFILPITYPSAGRPYYPVPAWQSIFSGDIYEYLMTMVSDRNRRRQNSNVIGRIIYLNNEYMQRLYMQKKADTDDQKLKVFTELRDQINNFLEDRDNTGKPLVAYTFLGSDGKVYESWKIVEIEANNKQTAEANQKELAEISSIVFFAFGLDSRLVGNSPGDVASSGGTDLRERYLLKQVQMSPMQQLLLLPLYLIKYFNDLDEHLEWEIPREVLTTLDNSKTGITNAEQPT